MNNRIKSIIAVILSSFMISSCSVFNKDMSKNQLKNEVKTDTKSDVKKEKVVFEDSKFSWKNATVYYAMTDRFNNGNKENDNSYGRLTKDALGNDAGTFHGGDFKGLTDKIKSNYFNDLGVNAIWISAPYEQIHGFISGGANGKFAHYAFHGYYPLDWTMTDRNFGTRDEFQEMVDEAHKKGIRIVLDVVLNHTGYVTLKDMGEYNFGKMVGISKDWQPTGNETYKYYEDKIDYNDAESFAKWWGKDFVRAEINGYDKGGHTEQTLTLAGLPDVKSESTQKISIPPLLKTKWQIESDPSYEPWKLKKAQDLRKDLNLTPAEYIIKWLGAWVYEFGIDGFRIDTAKHVDLSVWKRLKDEANASLKKWREENKGKSGSEFTDDFFMTGEVWGAGVVRNEYYDNGFDSLINFTFQGETNNGPAYDLSTMPKIFKTYSERMEKDKFNVLTYISSHDTTLYTRTKLKKGLTYQLLLPGAIEVFYGDETARKMIPTPDGDFAQATRSSMNWDSIDKDIFEHFKKLGAFRARNISIGAGVHEDLGKEPYTFMRSFEKDGYSNKVVVSIDRKEPGDLDVSKAFKDNDKLHDAYTGNIYTVKNGKINIKPDASGIVLLEKVK